ncbi:MAG: FkbM family methyltransferase [Paracoccaceae bacterium]|jgi:FkbM family methyltransferase
MPDSALHTSASEAAAETETETRLFGQTVTLITTGDAFTTGDSGWRARVIYEPYLTTRSLPATGTAIDIGAAYGGFAVPFALAYPGWKIWCFEPDKAAFDALSANIAAHGLTNVAALNVAISGDIPADDMPADLDALLKAGDSDEIAKACPKLPFRQHREKKGFVEATLTDVPHDEFEDHQFATLSANALNGLEPTLMKITAPGCEQAILGALRDSTLNFIFGEIWQPVRWDMTSRRDGSAREVYLPLAGGPLALRQTCDVGTQTRRTGLDVVVALYNAKEYIQECVDSIISNDCDSIHALVVDDGSTDGSGDFVEELYRDNPRVSLLRKPNGGCASARNFGRLYSDASHITFVDADDLCDADMFPRLMELAQYSGAEVVQAGFAFLEQDADGTPVLTPSYEDQTLADLQRQPFGDTSFFVTPNDRLMVGQPAIWRRVYRRDFLDNKKIWFPEHIRAFDDQIFQMLTLLYADDVYCTDQVRYHYRQHPGQDIKQGDERFFYSLEMFRMMLKRGLAEGWNDFDPILKSFVNTVNWINGGLRPDLKPDFIRGAAELWVYMQKALGPAPFERFDKTSFDAVDFDYHVQAYTDKLAGLSVSFMWGYLDSAVMHVDAVRAGKKA